MATNDIGRVTPIWRGFFSAAATYELNDIVIDTAGSVWWHKSPAQTTGEIPEAGEIWDAVIDMSVFSGLIQAAITTAQTALVAAQEAVDEVTADTERAETAAQNAETSALNAAEFAASVGAQAQAAERSAEAAAGSATGAAGSAEAAAGSKSDAEAYAVGTRGGEDVETTDPTFHNNAKYYSEQAASSAEAAAQSAEDAQDVLDSIPADYSTLSADVGDLKESISEAVDTTEVWNEVDLTVDNHGYYNIYGTYTSEANRRNAVVTGVNPGDLYRISTAVSSTLIAAIMYYNDNTLLSYEKAGSGTLEIVTDYEFTIPANCNKIIVQNSTGSSGEFELEKHGTTSIFKAYTKEETDAKLTGINKKYGIKWEISDPDDLGARCFDAVGLSATIGIGATNGSSDFDNIYPWSEMKRCNIKTNAAGAKIVTFEGETGFALDGTNGNVFVRIPKFYYERYQENGFEYRVISAIGTNAHPAFIENGEELDEIFIGAFEGVIESDKLKSKGGIIPTSNELGQTFLTAAQANGDEYSLYDNRCVDAVWNLMAIEYGCRNTNAIIGYGYADFLQATSGQYGVDCDTSATGTNIFSAAKTVPEARLNNMPVGSNVVICKGSQDNCIAFRKLVSRTSDANHWYLTFDGDPIDLDTTCFIGSAACTTNFCETVPSGALSWHTGRTNWIANSDTKNPVRYRWIENIVGSLWHILPDITFNNLQMYQCRNMKDYVMHKYTGAYKAMGDTFTENNDNGEKADVTGYNYWITELDNNIFTKGIDFGRVYNKQLTSKKAFGAYYYLWSGVKAIINGGGFDHLYRCNVLTQRAWLGATQKWYLYGARLIYKDVT